MRALKYGVLVCLFVLAGCATAVSVKNAKEGVAVCYKSVETVLNLAADVKARGKLSPGAQTSVVKSTDDARLSCDVARDALRMGNFGGANSALQVATAILLQVEALLSEAQK